MPNQALERSVRVHLKLWIAKLSILLSSLFILILANEYSLPLASSILPALTYELFHFYSVAKDLMNLEDSSAKKETLKELIDSMGCMLFKTLQMAYWLGHIDVFLLTIFPLLFASVVKKFIKTRDPCHSFSNFIFLFGRWSVTITLLVVGLKLDGIIAISWYLSLMPMWITLGMLFLISLGTLLLFIGSINTYLAEESDLQELLSLLWFFTASFGFSLTVWFFLYSLTTGESLLPSALPLCIFLSICLAISIPCFSLFVLLLEIMIATDLNREICILRDDAHDFGFLKQISSSFYQRYELNSTDNELGEHENHVKSCGICYCKDNNAVFMECGHGGFCYDCAIANWKLKGCCPLCRSDIGSVLEIQKHEKDLFKIIAFSRAEII